MAVETIHTYLVYPRSKAGEDREIGGVAVPLQGKLFDTLNGVYQKADAECDIEIAFTPREDGTQQNDCRDLILQYLRARTLVAGRAIASRLSLNSTNRSGLGLLFLMYGREGQDHRLVISRYPTDTGILAEEGDGGLNVQFLERVFMRSAYAYKAALYQHHSLNRFWDGRAVDKQVSSSALPSPEYWIHGFLSSDFRTTPAAGTRRLAVALKKAISSTEDLTLKHELISAATLVRGLAGQSISVTSFYQRYGLSDRAVEAVRSHLPNPAIAAQQFRLDISVLDREIAYRSIELDSGVLLTAQAGDFDDVIKREKLDATGGKEKFSTVGKIVNEKLRKGSVS